MRWRRTGAFPSRSPPPRAWMKALSPLVMMQDTGFMSSRLQSALRRARAASMPLWCIAEASEGKTDAPACSIPPPDLPGALTRRKHIGQLAAPQT